MEQSKGLRSSVVYSGPSLFEDDLFEDDSVTSQELFWHKSSVPIDGSFFVKGSHSPNSLSDRCGLKPPSSRGIVRTISDDSTSTSSMLSRGSVSFSDKVEYREYQKDQGSSPAAQAPAENEPKQFFPPEPRTLLNAARRGIASSSRSMTPNTKRRHRMNAYHTTYRRAGVGATEHFQSFEG